MSTSLLPPTRFQIERKKITAYLLNVDHPDGGAKARFFLRRGFKAADIDDFAIRILDHPLSARSTLTKTVADPYAPKFVYEGTLVCPDGTTAFLRSVWELRTGDTHARLVTIYPC